MWTWEVCSEAHLPSPSVLAMSPQMPPLFDILEWFLNAQKGQILNPDLVRNSVTYLRRTAMKCAHICEKIFLKPRNMREVGWGTWHRDLLSIEGSVVIISLHPLICLHLGAGIPNPVLRMELRTLYSLSFTHTHTHTHTLSLSLSLSLSVQSGLSSLHFGHLVLTGIVLYPWLCPLFLPHPGGSHATPNLLVPIVWRATQRTTPLSHGHYYSCFSPSTGLPKPRMVGDRCLQGPAVLLFNFSLDLALLRQGGNCSLEVNLWPVQNEFTFPRHQRTI